MSSPPSNGTAAPIPLYQPPGRNDGNMDPTYFSGPSTAFLAPYEQLGPIFRTRVFGAERVALGGVEANRFVWGHNELWDYHRTNAMFREQFSDRYLNQLDGAEYRHKRSRVNQGFKPSMLASHSGSMADVLHREIAKLPDGRTELRLFCMRAVIKMTSQVLLQTDLPDGMDTTMAISNKEMLRASSLGWKRWLWYQYPPKRFRRWQIFRFLGQVIDERESQTKEREDILSLILAAISPEERATMPRHELIHDLSQLFMAGSTTSSMIICWALLQCLADPAWLAEVRAELEPWDAAQLKGMGNFPKLRATGLETERLRPGVAVFNRICGQDFEYGGHVVKAGTPVLHLHTLAHFLAECYEDPLAFRPQRFLDNPDLPDRWVHGTYGGGAHQCVGQPLARLQPAIAIAEILRNYDLEFDEPPSLQERYDSVTAPREKALMVRFVRRG
jgi:cytochrome P450